MLCNMMYDPQQLLIAQSDVQQIPGYHALFVVEPLYRSNHPTHNLLRLSVDTLATVEDIITRMKREQERQTPGYASMIQAYFLQLVVMLSRLHASQIQHRDESIGRLAQAITMIETRYDESLTLDDLAAATHLSKTHLLRLFKETFAMSPMQYLIRLRIAKACHLLRDKHRNISTIAFDVGFNDSNYFSRQFRQVMGCSPRAYRQRLRDLSG